MHCLRYLAGVATFCPLNSRRIKRSRASEWSDQGRFSPIKILDPGRKRFYRQGVYDYPLHKEFQPSTLIIALFPDDWPENETTLSIATDTLKYFTTFALHRSILHNNISVDCRSEDRN